MIGKKFIKIQTVAFCSQPKNWLVFAKLRVSKVLGQHNLPPSGEKFQPASLLQYHPFTLPVWPLDDVPDAVLNSPKIINTTKVQ